VNLIQYIIEVQKYEADESVSRLIKHLNNWLEDDSDIDCLVNSIEKLFGNIWIDSAETHSHLYQLWSTFKTKSIDCIGGMTMNERLYFFGLFNRFDNCKSSTQKESIYSKLHAKM